MKARENPFRSEKVDRLAFRAQGFSWEALESALKNAGGRGAIVGPEGHGKTTLLSEWAERWRIAGENVVWIRLSEGQRRLGDAQRRLAARGGWVFVDSAEQLGWLGWRELRWLAQRAGALIITTHRPGRLPILFECRTCPQLLSDLVAELKGGTPDCFGLWKRHRGNLRLALRELYDDCAVGN